MEGFLSKQEGLSLDINQQRLTAAGHVTAGTVLLTQPPLASVPLPSIRAERCNYCLRKAPLQCCSRCHSAYFCSNECFRNAWVHFHRVLCEPQETDVYTHVDADRWLLERAALTLHSHTRLSKHHSHSPPHLPVVIEALNSLPSKPKDEKDDDGGGDDDNSNMPQSPAPLPTPPDMEAVAAALKPFDCYYTEDELRVLWHRLTMATFDIVDHDQHLDPIALGVYPLTALYVAHSCRPNCAVVYKRGAQILVAIESIAPGEALTISYTDLMANKPMRLAALRQRFGSAYTCHCERCEGDLAVTDMLLDKCAADQDPLSIEDHCRSWNVLSMTLHYTRGGPFEGIATPRTLDVPNFTHYTSRILSPDIYRYQHYGGFKSLDLSVTTTEERHKRLLLALFSLTQIPSVPAFSLTAMDEAKRLLRRLITADRWVEASRAALYLFVAYRLLFPPIHPVVCYHALILARTCWNSLVQLELAGIGKKLERVYLNGVRTWINVARKSIQSTFGQDCNLWREIIELQWIFERDQKLKLT
ncbi:hypothetical protein BX666DRAFT_2021714 [Dichotomocladium elegans]|nr:hypothetical protein BX666DRAFT_2021714 [Dichotomocladium elegans]